MNHIVCSPEVANLLNLKPTVIPKNTNKNTQKSDSVISYEEITDFIQDELFSYKATGYFGEY